ncbi:MAG: ChrR family anti-sigma-E factor, partial [Boseongicola sp.]|nr:ChrR family anti-sigma-E factor [Boseongicola sp.]
MEQINHHLNDSLLMGYASGNLPEGFSLVVATHISLCDECRARLESFNAVGGALMDEDGEVEMAEDSLASTLELIANAPEAPKSTVPTKGAVLPTPLQSYVGGDLDKVRWRSLGGGVKQSVLKTSSKATVRLLQIPAGAAMPDHGHRGTELTLVLKGAFRDEDGRFGRGDIEIANEDLH